MLQMDDSCLTCHRREQNRANDNHGQWPHHSQKTLHHDNGVSL